MFIIIWEFYVRPESKDEFTRINQPGGEWITLSSKADEYLDTEILNDFSDDFRIITIDRWSSQQAYENFGKEYQTEYQKIDEQLEKLTKCDRLLGSFEVCP